MSNTTGTTEHSFHDYFPKRLREEMLSSIQAWLDRRPNDYKNIPLDLAPIDSNLHGPLRWKLMVSGPTNENPVIEGGGGDWNIMLYVRLSKEHRWEQDKPKSSDFSKTARATLRSMITGDKLSLMRRRDVVGFMWVWTCTYTCKAEGPDVPNRTKYHFEYLLEIRHKKLDASGIAVLEADDKVY